MQSICGCINCMKYCSKWIPYSLQSKPEISVFCGVRGHNYFSKCLFTKTFFCEEIIPSWDHLLKKVLGSYPLIKLSYYIFCLRLQLYSRLHILWLMCRCFDSDTDVLCSFFSLWRTFPPFLNLSNWKRSRRCK